MGAELTALKKVLDADRALRQTRVAFLDSGDPKMLVRAIATEVDRAMGETEGTDAGARLMVLADLLVELSGSEASKGLLKILGHDDPGVRVAAGEGLIELLSYRYAEVARVIETTVDEGKDVVALREIPFILAEIGEPGSVKIAAKLLKHADADVVGAAVEALAHMGDPSVIAQLEALAEDKRPLTGDEDDEEGGESPPTVGDLVAEALEELRAARPS